jgi:hypothetical protein
MRSSLQCAVSSNNSSGSVVPTIRIALFVTSNVLGQPIRASADGSIATNSLDEFKKKLMTASVVDFSLHRLDSQDD